MLLLYYLLWYYNKNNLGTWKQSISNMKEELKETEKKEEDELESLFNTFDEKYKNFEQDEEKLAEENNERLAKSRPMLAQTEKACRYASNILAGEINRASNQETKKTLEEIQAPIKKLNKNIALFGFLK